MMTSSDDDESGSSQDFRFRIQNSKKTADEVPAGEAGDAHSSTLSLISVLEDFNKHNVMYRKSVSEWSVVLYYNHSLATNDTVFGPYEMLDMKNQIIHAAARCGFNLTDAHGPRVSEKTSSFSLRCSCGRDLGDKAEPKPFVKALDSIVASTSTKQRTVRPGRFGGGWMRAHTQRGRSKFCSCDFEFNFTSHQIDEHGLFSWKFNTRRNCKNITLHSGHPRTGRAIMTQDVLNTIRGLADNFTVPSILQLLRQQFKAPFTRSQIRYTSKHHSIALEGHKAIARSGAGGVAPCLAFLQRTKATCMMLLQKIDGDDDGKMFTYSSRTPTAVRRIPDYDGNKPVLEPDPSRIFALPDGRRFLVLCFAFNWDTDAEIFEMFHDICIIDCMHGNTNSTDGMNCIGVDGNLHNVTALRVFIFAQTQETFRWVLCEAFPDLVKNYDKIKVFFSDDDQHMGPVLKMLVGRGKLFPLAVYLKCTWHLIRHNIEDTFGKSVGETPWQERLISILSKLRKCETLEEYDSCVRWM